MKYTKKHGIFLNHKEKNDQNNNIINPTELATKIIFDNYTINIGGTISFV